LLSAQSGDGSFDGDVATTAALVPTLVLISFNNAAYLNE
jgi:hypothetical protein